MEGITKKSGSMTPDILQFLADMATEMFSIIGAASLPLMVLLVFRAGRLRGLRDENMNSRLGDLCFDTLKEQIEQKLGSGNYSTFISIMLFPLVVRRMI